MKKESKCYSKGCLNKVEYKWLPNRNKGHLPVCKEHFDLLSEIYYTENVGMEDDLIVVRALPEPE